MNTDIQSILDQLGVKANNAAFSTGSIWGGDANAESLESFSPVDGKLIASTKVATTEDYNKIVEAAQAAFA